MLTTHLNYLLTQ